MVIRSGVMPEVVRRFDLERLLGNPAQERMTCPTLLSPDWHSHEETAELLKQ